MPNSLRKRVKKMAHLGEITEQEAERIRVALAKQIPTKPTSYGGLDIGRCNTNDVKYRFCPNCGSEEITAEESCKNFNHCPDCGQAIDWSES